MNICTIYCVYNITTHKDFCTQTLNQLYLVVFFIMPWMKHLTKKTANSAMINTKPKVNCLCQHSALNK